MVSFTAAWIAVVLTIVAVFGASLAVILWSRRKSPESLISSLLFLAVSVWCIGYVGEILSATLPAKMAWAHLQYPAISAVPLTWFLLSISLARGRIALTRNWIALLAVFPAATVIVEWSNGLHQLAWTSVDINQSGSVGFLTFERGPWFLAKVTYSYSLLLLGAGLIAKAFVSGTGARRSQLALALAAVAIPASGNAAFVLGLIPDSTVDLTPFAFAIAGLAITLGIVRCGMFSIRREAEDRLIAELPDPVLILDSKLNLLDANPAGFGLLERSSGGNRIEGSHICDVIRSVAGRHRLCNAAVFSQMVDRWAIGDEHRTVDLRISPLGGGHSSGRMIVVRDVTDLFAKEDELLLKNALLESQSEAVPEGILVVAEDGQWLSVNSRFREIWGLSDIELGDFGTAEALQLVSEKLDDPDAFNHRVEEIYRSNGETAKERIELKSGVILERFTAPVKGPNGEVYGRLWSYRDITESVMASEFASRLGQMTLLNEIANVTSAANDIEGEISGVLKVVSERLPASWVMIGRRAERDGNRLELRAYDERTGEPVVLGDLAEFEEISGLSLDGASQCVSGLVSQAFFADRQILVTPLNSDQTQTDFILVARDGGAVFSETEAELMEAAAGQIAIGMSRASTVAELKRVNAELQETRDLAMRQERLTALGEMASGIAHDINNALSPVVGFSELMLRKKDKLDERGQKYLTAIHTSALDVSNIVARMREFYRQRTGDSELEPIEIKALIEEVVLLTSPRWKNQAQKSGTRIEVTTNLEERVPIILGVPFEIREALTNLVINASDAMPDGGQIEISASMERIRGAESLLVQVKDTGSGMDSETVKKALEPFFSTKGDRGTGLGLAMVYGVMQRHGGDVEINSKPGFGTTISLRFAIGGGQRSSREAIEDVPELGDSLSVLVVDDEPALRELLEQMLLEEGHEVAVTASGQAATELFSERLNGPSAFDAVITDLGMPGIHGNEVVSLIKELDPTCPVIVLSGWGDRFASGENEKVSLQADVVLSKPPRIGEIRDALTGLAAAHDKAA